MSILQSIVFDEICQRRNIRDSDVTKLRALYMSNALAAPDDVTALIKMNSACPVQGEAWAPFLIEAVVDFVVGELEPRGYLSKPNAQWLIDLIAPEGTVTSLNGLDILLAVIERARWVPESFLVFLLAQIRGGIVDGAGPLRTASGLEPNTVAEGDIALASFAITHFASEGFIPVTRGELLELGDVDAQSNAETHPTEWDALYLRMLAAVLLYQNGYAASSRWQLLDYPITVPADDDGNINLGSDAWIAQILEPVIGAHRLMAREDRAIHALEQQRVAIITDSELTAAGPAELAQATGHSNVRRAQLRTIGRTLAQAGFDVTQGPTADAEATSAVA